MTSNQINYAKAREDERHNREIEQIEYGKLSESRYANTINLMNAETRQGELLESMRSHKASESLQQEYNTNQMLVAMSQMQETARHNYAMESENARHNAAAEYLTQMQTNESVRHNQSLENLQYTQTVETQRHNESTESLTSQKQFADAGYKALDVIKDFAGMAIKLFA